MGRSLHFSKPPNGQEKAVTVNVSKYLVSAIQQLKSTKSSILSRNIHHLSLIQPRMLKLPMNTVEGNPTDWKEALGTRHFCRGPCAFLIL